MKIGLFMWVLVFGAASYPLDLLGVVLAQAAGLPNIDMTQFLTTGGFGGMLWYFVFKKEPATEARHAKEREVWQGMAKDFTDKIGDLTAELAKLGGKQE